MKERKFLYGFKPDIPKFQYSNIPAFDPIFHHSIIPMG
jgi:hypothetical protein